MSAKSDLSMSSSRILISLLLSIIESTMSISTWDDISLRFDFWVKIIKSEEKTIGSIFWRKLILLLLMRISHELRILLSI